jgi:chromosome segregation ATPase
MSSQLLAAFGMSFAVVSLGMALYFWQKRGELYALLMEGSSRFEELRQRAQTASEAQTAAEERLKATREASTRLERAVDEAREKSTELTRRLEAKEQEARLVAERLETQKAVLERHLERTMEVQRRTEEREAAGSNAVAEAQREFAQKAAAVKAEAERRVQPLRQKIEELERALAIADARASKAVVVKPAAHVDPAALANAAAAAASADEMKDELKRLRRRIAQADRLFGQMRGLKEMVEERSQNWEIALRKLSTWIISERGVAGARPPEAIGPLVGQALAAIGAQLIDDDDLDVIDRPAQGAVRASNMDSDSDVVTGAPETP